jgi:hypothetical protein
MTLPVELSLDIIEALHKRWTMFLSALPDSAWTRKAQHPDHGEITMDSLLEIYGDHGHNHARQITDLRARKGW